MSLFRNAISVLTTTVAVVPVQFVTSVVLARYLSVADRGLYGVALAFVVVGTMIAELGWGPALIYRVLRAGVPAARMAALALGFAVLEGGLVVVACLSMQGWILTRLMDGAPPPILYLALAAVPIRLGWVLFTSLARARDRFALQNWSMLMVSSSRLVGMVIVLILRHGAVYEALCVYLAAEALGTAVVAGQVIRDTGLSFRISWSDIREIQSFGIQAYVARLGAHLHERVDIFMLAYFLVDARYVGLYAVAVALITQLKVIPEAIGRALYPHLAASDEKQMAGVTARASRHAMGWVLLTTVAVAVLAPFAVPLVYGEPYRASVPALLILLPAMALLTRYRVLSTYFVSVGRQRVNVMSQATALAVNVTLNALLIPRMGIVGAAWASLASYGLVAVWISFAFAIDSGTPLGRTLVMNRADLGEYRRRLEPLLRRVTQGGSS